MLVSLFIKHYEGVMIRYKRPLVNHRECSLHKSMNSKSFIHHDLVVALSSQALFDISGVLVLIWWHIQYLPSFFLFFIFIFWKQAPEFNFLFFSFVFISASSIPSSSFHSDTSVAGARQYFAPCFSISLICLSWTPTQVHILHYLLTQVVY